MLRKFKLGKIAALIISAALVLNILPMGMVSAGAVLPEPDFFYANVGDNYVTLSYELIGQPTYGVTLVKDAGATISDYFTLEVNNQTVTITDITQPTNKTVKFSFVDALELGDTVELSCIQTKQASDTIYIHYSNNEVENYNNRFTFTKTLTTDWEGDTALNIDVSADGTFTYELPDLPSDASYSNAPVIDANSTDTGDFFGSPDPSIAGTTLSYKISGIGSHEAGDFQTLTISVTDSAMYNDYDIVLTLTYAEPATIIIGGQPSDITLEFGATRGNNDSVDISQVKSSVDNSLISTSNRRMQWYETNSTANTDITDTTNVTPVSGATGGVYVIPDDLSVGVHYFFCVVTSTQGLLPATSDVATVTITKPLMTDDTVLNKTGTVKASVSDQDGLTFELPALPTGAAYGTPTYASDSKNIGKGKTDSSVTKVTGGTTLNFSVYPTDSDTVSIGDTFTIEIPVTGATDYSDYKVTVVFTVAGIEISTQPTDQTVDYGDGATLSVTAAATPSATLGYQWYQAESTSDTSGLLLSGEENSSLTIPTTKDAGTYYYYCVIGADGYDEVKTSTATVQIDKLDALDTLTKDYDGAADATGNGLFALPALPAGASYGTPTVTENTNDIIGSTVTVEDYDALFLQVAWDTGNNGVIGRTAKVSIPIVGGTNYKSDPLVVTITLQGITIDTQPTTAQETYGTTFTGSLNVVATHSASAPLTYKWYKCDALGENGVEQTSATTSTLLYPFSLTPGTHYYYCEVSSTDYTTVKSSVGVVTVDKANATNDMMTASGTLYKTVMLSTQQEVTLPALPDGAAYGTPTVTSDTGQSMALVATPLKLIMDSSSSLSIANGKLLYWQNAAVSSGVATVKIPVTGATNYNDYDITVTITAIDLKTITISTQPDTVVGMTYGDNESLTVAGTGEDDSAITYQWYRNTTAPSETGALQIQGATSATLDLSSMAAGTSYVYCVLKATGHSDKASGFSTVTIAKGTWSATTGTKDTVANIALTGNEFSLEPVAAPGLANNNLGTITVNGALIDGTPVITNGILKFNTTSQPGGTTATITIAVSNLANYADYNIVITVTAVASPSITVTTQPTAVNTTYGAITQSLTVAATATNGNAVSYQWAKVVDNNGTPEATELNGETSSTFAIPTDLEAGTYYYVCLLSADGCSDDASDFVTVTVAKATWTNTTATANVPAGEVTTGKTVSIASLIAPDTSFGIITVDNALIDGDPIISSGVLTFNTTSQPSGTIARITIPVDSSPNYNDYDIVVTVTADSRTEIIFTATPETGLVYNGLTHRGIGILEGTPAYHGTYVSSYVGVNGTTYGPTSDRPKNAGDYKLTISIPESDQDYVGTADFTFSIGKKAVTVAPKNVSITQNSTMPTFALEYTGVVSGETLTPSEAATFSTNADGTSATGTYTITWDNIDSVDFADTNYSVTKTATGTLTITPANQNQQTPTPPKTPGNVTVDTKPGESAPSTGIASSPQEMGDLVLTPEDLSRIAAGESAQIYITIEDIGDDVPEGDKAATQQLLDTNTAIELGMYIDISLFKQLGSDDPTKVTLANGNLLISIEIPEELRIPGRSFSVVRVHDGVAELLTGTYDSDTGILTFETDRFSTYALVYTYEEVEEIDASTEEEESEEDEETGEDDEGTDDFEENVAEENTPEDTTASETDTSDTNPSTGASLSLIPVLAFAAITGISRKKNKK